MHAEVQHNDERQQYEYYLVTEGVLTVLAMHGISRQRSLTEGTVSKVEFIFLETMVRHGILHQFHLI